MESGQSPTATCPRCGETVAQGQECPKCGRTAPTAEMRPLGGWVGSTPEQTESPPAGATSRAGEQERPRTGPQGHPGPASVPPSSPIRDPRVALERRRRERAEQEGRYAKLSYSQYLGTVLRQDHVFAALLVLMALMIALEVASGSWPARILGICQAVGFFGILTFQRWAHTVVVWLVGVGLLSSAIGLFGLVLQPLHVSSQLAVASSWLSWLITTATCVFVLVVLMERRAYFEGAQARVPPKQRRLKDVWASAKHDLKPADPYEVRAPVDDARPRTTAAQRRIEPSAYDPMGETAASQRPDGTSPQMPILSDRDTPRDGRGTDAQAPPRPGTEPTRKVTLPPRQASHDRYRVEPAPGQVGQDCDGVRKALSWGHIRDLARQDPVFGLLLALLVLQAIVVVAGGSPMAIIGAAAIICGIIILNVWAFWGALVVSAMLALWHLRLLSVADEVGGTGGMVFFGAVAGLNLLIVGLLLARRERFS